MCALFSPEILQTGAVKGLKRLGVVSEQGRLKIKYKRFVFVFSLTCQVVAALHHETASKRTRITRRLF